MAFASYRTTIDSIYRAARDPREWSRALEQTADCVGGSGALIAHHDFSINQGTLITGRLREDLSELYLQRYGHNPYSVGILRHPAGSVHLARALADPATVRRTAFHADILAPQRIADKLIAGHAPFMSLSHSGGFAVTLDTRAADDAERRRSRMARLTPHLSAALELSHLIGRLSTQNRELQALLNAMPLPSIILNAKGCIESLNAAAEAMLSRNDCLSVEPGLKIATRRRDQRSILAGLLAGASGPDASPVIRRIMGMSSLFLLVKGTPLPASFAAEWHGRGGDARLLLQIVAPFSLNPQPDIRGWLELFGLTPAEARVATLFGRGLSAAKIAELAGISVNTVRTHIAHCFAKTGVHSQAALVRFATLIEQLDRSPN